MNVFHSVTITETPGSANGLIHWENFPQCSMGLRVALIHRRLHRRLCGFQLQAEIELKISGLPGQRSS